MGIENFLLMQKATDAAAKSTGQWGIYLTTMSMLDSHECKDLEANDWMDEDGEDVYLASSLKLKAFDATVGMICKGTMEEIQAAYKSLLTYLTTGGCEMKIYNDYIKQGRQKVYYKSTSSPEYDISAGGHYATWNITFRVTDPLTEICCSKSGTDYLLTIK